jgi:hypothetical protein
LGDDVEVTEGKEAALDVRVGEDAADVFGEVLSV